MDKTKWVKTTLGEVVSFLNGYTPTKEEISGSDVIPYFKVAEMNIPGNERYLVKTNFYVDVNRRLFPENSIVFPKNGAAVSTNKKRILKQKSVVDLNTSVVIVSEPLYFKFVYYWFQSKDFNDFIRRGAIPTLNINLLKNEIILFPTRIKQEQIVVELDAVQEMIDCYKVQIKDLDELAKSIFLDMFGDPISNTKGWKTDFFCNLFKLKSGSALSAKNMNHGLFPVYGGNGITGNHSDFNMDGEYILIGRVGAYCGNVRLVNGRFWLTDNAFEVINKTNNFNNRFLLQALRLLNLGRKAHKEAQPVISNVVLKDIKIFLPPLTLQQHFAMKVEAIEKQKELLRQQQADAETLMAERMQYYFS